MSQATWRAKLSESSLLYDWNVASELAACLQDLKHVTLLAAVFTVLVHFSHGKDNGRSEFSMAAALHHSWKAQAEQGI